MIKHCKANLQGLTITGTNF